MIFCLYNITDLMNPFSGFFPNPECTWVCQERPFLFCSFSRAPFPLWPYGLPLVFFSARFLGPPRGALPPLCIFLCSRFPPCPCPLPALLFFCPDGPPGGFFSFAWSAWSDLRKLVFFGCFRGPPRIAFDEVLSRFCPSPIHIVRFRRFTWHVLAL